MFATRTRALQKLRSTRRALGSAHRLAGHARVPRMRVCAWAALAIGVLERARSDAGLPVSTGAAVAKELQHSALRDCVKSSDRGAYAIALAIAHDLETQVLLGSKLAQISDPTAQGYVAVSLGMLGARDSIEPIQELVRESKYKPELLRQAAIGLGLLGD